MTNAANASGVVTFRRPAQLAFDRMSRIQLWNARIHFSFMKSLFALSPLVVKGALAVTLAAALLASSPLRAQQVQPSGTFTWKIATSPIPTRMRQRLSRGGLRQHGRAVHQQPDHAGNTNAQFVSYCSHYHHVMAGPTAPHPASQSWVFNSSTATATMSNNLDVHPSEPNYVWQEAGLTSASTTTTIRTAVASRCSRSPTTSRPIPPPRDSTSPVCSRPPIFLEDLPGRHRPADDRPAAQSTWSRPVP